MSIAAANVGPSFLGRQRITMEQLAKVDEPCVVFEHFWHDEDQAPCYAYTIGGFLKGKVLGSPEGGCTVGGDVIIVHAESRPEADEMALYGLLETVAAARVEGELYVEAQQALTRLNMVNAIRRAEIAMSNEQNADFQKDTKAIELLRGDDVVLGAGGMQ